MFIQAFDYQAAETPALGCGGKSLIFELEIAFVVAGGDGSVDLPLLGCPVRRKGTVYGIVFTRFFCVKKTAQTGAEDPEIPLVFHSGGLDFFLE
ncbi:hypothetical protein ES703_63634 [subsurface metagenome]